MSEPVPVSARGMLFCAAVAAAIGIYFALVGVELLPTPGGPRNLHAPLWLVFCAGLAFFLAGLALFVQGIGHADATGELPAEAPRWMRLAQFLICLTIFICFGLMSSWVAFGPGERQFSGSFALSGHAGDVFGRIVFGFGAVIVWLGTAAVGVYGLRKFVRRTPSGAP